MPQPSDFDLSQEGALDASEEEVVSPRMAGTLDTTPNLGHRVTRRPRSGLSTWVIAGTVVTLLFLAGVAALGSLGLLAVWGLSP
ncbi:MAG: hypothetical protein KC621_22455 [Myxococcales bacterium]|nr:hypothetical protein [Myxococcales bacterium]